MFALLVNPQIRCGDGKSVTATVPPELRTTMMNVTVK
jgi:hypothetical protein